MCTCGGIRGRGVREGIVGRRRRIGIEDVGGGSFRGVGGGVSSVRSVVGSGGGGGDFIAGGVGCNGSGVSGVFKLLTGSVGCRDDGLGVVAGIEGRRVRVIACGFTCMVQDRGIRV